MRRLLLALLIVCAGGPAGAVYLDERDGVATLSGPFQTGDTEAFEAFLKKSRAIPLRVLWLSSEGGRLKEGLGIGRLVRKAGLATAVDAARAFCDSACTLVFAAGKQRHYVKSESILDGFSSFTGLGFHPAHQRGDRITPSLKSAEGSAEMQTFYARMGMPRAGELAGKAAFNTVYRVSGKTALAFRIATSLAAPP